MQLSMNTRPETFHSAESTQQNSDTVGFRYSRVVVICMYYHRCKMFRVLLSSILQKPCVKQVGREGMGAGASTLDSGIRKTLNAVRANMVQWESREQWAMSDLGHMQFSGHSSLRESFWWTMMHQQVIYGANNSLSGQDIQGKRWQTESGAKLGLRMSVCLRLQNLLWELNVQGQRGMSQHMSWGLPSHTAVEKWGSVSLMNAAKNEKFLQGPYTSKTDLVCFNLHM